jgi:hypothetical protein
MKRVSGLLVLVIALFAAAACTGTGQNSGTRTGAGFTPTPTATADAGPTPSAEHSVGNPALGVPDPRKRMLLGAYVSLSGESSGEASVAARERAMGRPYDLELTYYNWTDSFPDANEDAIAARGTTPLMAWYLPDKEPGSGASLSTITSGAEDGWIRTQARAIKAFRHRVFLRLGPEMNGNWYGYSGDPAAYIAAWRHIWTVFADLRVTNVTWVWCPNLTPANWDAYYPGNRYVNVIGVDGFSNTTYTWETFQQMFAGFFAHFASFAPGKPQLVVETATNSGAGVPGAGVGSAATFITGMMSYLQEVAGPQYGVIGVCWFDTDTNNNYNWRVDQTAASWQAWLALARNPYFGGHGPLPSGRPARATPGIGASPHGGRSAIRAESPPCPFCDSALSADACRKAEDFWWDVRKIRVTRIFLTSSQKLTC